MEPDLHTMVASVQCDVKHIIGQLDRMATNHHELETRTRATETSVATFRGVVIAATALSSAMTAGVSAALGFLYKGG